MNINLQAEYVMSVFGYPITNTFFTSILVTILLCILGIVFYVYKNNNRNIIINGIRILIFELLKLTDKEEKRTPILKGECYVKDNTVKIVL